MSIIPYSSLTNKTFKKHIDGSLTTSTIDDIIFLSKGKKRIDAKKSLRKLGNTNMVNLRWPFQKSLDNGKELTFVSNVNPDLCFVKDGVAIKGRCLFATRRQNQFVRIYRRHSHCNVATRTSVTSLFNHR